MGWTARDDGIRSEPADGSVGPAADADGRIPRAALSPSGGGARDVGMRRRAVPAHACGLVRADGRAASIPLGGDASPSPPCITPARSPTGSAPPIPWGSGGALVLAQSNPRAAFPTSWRTVVTDWERARAAERVEQTAGRLQAATLARAIPPRRCRAGRRRSRLSTPRPRRSALAAGRRGRCGVSTPPPCAPGPSASSGPARSPGGPPRPTPGRRGSRPSGGTPPPRC